MSSDSLIRQALEEWSADVPVPRGLADRAIRRRTRRRITSTALAVGSAVVLAGAGLAYGVHGSGPAPATRPADTSLHTDTAHAPPQHFVAAGRLAISAYSTATVGTNNRGSQKIARSWSLYDPATGSYRKVPWAWLDVATGLRQAAVLPGPLPASRVGILDMSTQKVTRWIHLNQGAGGVSWSPDGRKLLVTTYAADPDRAGVESKRTGFALVDPESGKASYHSLPAQRAEPMDPNGRQDLAWSRNGKLIWAPRTTEPYRAFYDLNGAPRPAPPHEGDDDGEAGLSPNGRLVAAPGPAPGPNTTVKDVRTGRQIAVQPVETTLAWADDGHLFAMACPPDKCRAKGEFYNRLVLVSVDGKTLIPLTGYTQNTQDSDVHSWVPVFTHR